MAFLKEVSRFCLVHVYTMGSESYTREVLALIDPHASFEGHVLCRKDGDEVRSELTCSFTCSLTGLLTC